MKILSGKIVKEIDASEFNNIIKQYRSLLIDIGTGEGEFVYRKARRDKEMMFIGIDAAADLMHCYSVKSCKKTERGGVRNLLYAVENADDLPDILSSSADIITVNFPWGSLRDGIIKGEKTFLENIRKIAKTDAILEVYISYSDKYEKKEIESRQLPNLTLDYLQYMLKNTYKKYGINAVQVLLLDNDCLKKLDTKWAKKLAYGRKRDVFYFRCKILKE